MVPRGVPMGAWVYCYLGAWVPNSTATVGISTNPSSPCWDSWRAHIIILEFVGPACWIQGILYLKHTNPPRIGTREVDTRPRFRRVYIGFYIGLNWSKVPNSAIRIYPMYPILVKILARGGKMEKRPGVR